MQIFRKLRNFRFFSAEGAKSETDFSLPYGMTDGDYKALQRLWKSEDFETLTKTLDNIITLYGEQLLGTASNEQVHFLRGKILGIRFLAEFVDELKLKEQDYAIHQQRRSTKPNDAQRTRTATFGTPAWRRTN